MTRRDALKAGVVAAAVAPLTAAPSAGRLKQSLARWCYAKIPIDDLCRAAAGMGITGMDLVAPEDWPTLRKYGIMPAMVQGSGTFNDGWNNKANHEKLEEQARTSIIRAADAKVPNVITLFGARRGMSDQEGIENCITGVMPYLRSTGQSSGATRSMPVIPMPAAARHRSSIGILA